MDQPDIIHAGLLLRRYSNADAEQLTAAVLESVASVGPWLPWCTADFSIDHSLSWFELCASQLAAGTAFEYGIFCHQSGKLLGGAGLNDIRQRHKLCNLGYWVRQSAQGQGVASRAVQALAARAFRELGLQRVEIVVAVGNTASEAVALKSGAVREGIARNRVQIGERSMAAHMFSLVPDQA
ncbi:MAG: GNAT family protein [Duganella sp.]